MSDRPGGDASVRDAGDSGVLLQLAPVIDPAVNARAIGIATAIRRQSLRGVRDVMSTFRSVAVHVDPLLADVGAVKEALLDASTTADVAGPGRVHEVPVGYGGVAGPDLAGVAAFAGIGEADVIARHAAVPYRVYMLGFQPGFPYLGLVDPMIAAPRLPTPRVRVPAGSIGIAGRQTGIYPSMSPGGWQIIGRTSIPMMEPGSTPRALLAPGDTVRFVARSIDFEEWQVPPESCAPTRVAPGGRQVTVLRPGLFTTIQDSGRWGEQGIGMPVSGAMDSFSHALANRVVGNGTNAATLEVTLAGPELRLEQQTTIAIAGADLSATLDSSACPLLSPIACRPGSVLRFGARVDGARAYVAFDGGVLVGQRWPVMPLRAGDVIGLGPAAPLAGRALAVPNRMPVGGARLRVLPGPQHGEVGAEVLERLAATRFTIAPQSNRMGYRLRGSILAAAAGGEMISDATFAGGIQVPPDGEPILLMNDRQTTGGYPQVATVISADLCAAGQLAPGDWVEFTICSRAEALAALRAQVAMQHG